METVLFAAQAGVETRSAAFWTDSQKAFLREEILEDADWAHVVDELNVRLRRSRL